MALSGSSSTLQIPVIGCQFYFTWSATQSIENNTSTVTVIVYSARYSSGGWFTGAKNKNSYSVAGTASGVLTANGVPQGSTQYQWIEQSRWTTTVAHNSDGTKTGVVISARVYQTPSPTYDETISVTVNLDTIPRATEITAVSNITVSGTSPTSFAVTLSRKSSTFKHTITLKIGNSTVASWEAAQGADFTGAGTLSLNLDQRLNILEAIPNTMSAVMTLTVVTKNASGTTIGSKSKPATCNISTTVKPSIGSINISISTPSGAVSGKSRAYAVQNISTITAGHSATPGLGATLDARHVRIGQTVYTQAPYSGKPTTSGSVEVMIWLMDSRKQEASYTTTVSVVAYKQLSAQVQYLGRPLDSSSPQNRLSASLRLTVSPITYSSATTNAYRVTIAAVPVGGGSTITSVNETTNPGSASNTLKNYNPTTAHDETKSYTVTITVRDDYSLATIQGSLSTAAHPFVLGDIGVGIGGIPQSGRVLDVYDPINKGIYVNDTLIPANIQSQVTTLATTVSNIIDTGTNTNGRYIKYADGTQICEIDTIACTRETVNSLRADWTFPAGFVSTVYALSPTIIYPTGLTGSVRDVGVIYIRERYQNSCRIQIQAAGSYNWASSDVINISCIAVGRWKA